jgi:hypothetical protein
MPDERSGYPPNTRLHAVGDLVIHRHDYKSNEWLMRVVSYARDGRVRTVYESQGETCAKIWENPLEALLDPRRPDVRDMWRGPAFEEAT